MFIELFPVLHNRLKRKRKRSPRESKATAIKQITVLVNKSAYPGGKSLEGSVFVRNGFGSRLKMEIEIEFLYNVINM